MVERTTPRDPARPVLAAAPYNLDGRGAVLLHRRMAALIHNVSVDLRQLAREPHNRTKTFRDLSVVGRVVHEQAVAIGVPADWIAHAKKAGQQGRRATEAVSLPPRRPAARSLLIAQLHHQVDTLATLAAVGPVRRDRAAVTVQASDKLAEHLRLQWMRVAMVATALDVTEAETNGWWSLEATDWRARLDQISQQSAPDQGRQWRELTHVGRVREGRVRVAAMRMVGIDLARSAPHQLPPAPHMLETAAETTRHTAPLEPDSGAGIGAAIAATGIEDSYGIADGDLFDLPPPGEVAHPQLEPDF
ncbi:MULTISPECIES: hypothetical protein [Nocardia]|uniref:Uncharacterized protein n=1 Tax=Nocardia coubleae TaxID=356147 RepID=A0A846WCL1_9NOCA|nr:MULTISPECIES: hypothetical protein [Nocardia]NKX91249.1 hypothetical protein [Nocardia coubleae]